MSSIKIKYHIIKPANHFYFLYNISRWHHSCRPQIYNYWPKKTGVYTSAEKKSIKEFRIIIQKHRFTLWKLFIFKNYKKIFKKISACSALDQKEKIHLKKSIQVTRERFEKVWEKEGQNLKKWHPIISNYSKNTAIINDLINFFGKNKYKNVNVLLLMGGDRPDGGGGANIGGNWIEQEIGLRNKNLKRIKNVLWHEITHLLYTNQNNKTIKKYLKKTNLEKRVISLSGDGKGVQVIYEAVTLSLFPDGILAEKHFKTKIRKSITKNDLANIKELGPDLNVASKFMIAKSYNNLKYYHKNNLKFDENYIKIIHQGYLKYLELFRI